MFDPICDGCIASQWQMSLPRECDGRLCTLLSGLAGSGLYRGGWFSSRVTRSASLKMEDDKKKMQIKVNQLIPCVVTYPNIAATTAAAASAAVSLLQVCVCVCIHLFDSDLLLSSPFPKLPHEYKAHFPHFALYIFTRL